MDASANRLKILPPSLGYAKLLSTCLLQDNPLEDPPMDEVLKGLEKLQWYLRQRYMIIERGMPPPMGFCQISIEHEVTVLRPELMLRVKHMIEVNQHMGPAENILNLQLLGLTEIPKVVFSLLSLLPLSLSFSHTLSLFVVPSLLLSLTHSPFLFSSL